MQFQELGCGYVVPGKKSTTAGFTLNDKGLLPLNQQVAFLGSAPYTKGLAGLKRLRDLMERDELAFPNYVSTLFYRLRIF